MSNLFDRVLTLQRVPQGGFSYINSSQGIPLNSGMQFYIDSVSTAFFPPVSPLSADPNKYRKQKWLSIGLEGNSFRRYINENRHLNGIPSGLEPGHFVYFTIEPKSSLLESGTNSPADQRRYISSLRAKPYMVVQNDANRDNSYEKTPSNLFTGVSGNNNFVRFHPQSRYKDLALQSLRFHPVIGNGYANYNLRSGASLNIQPKNHHLETFIEINVLSGNRVNYGSRSRSVLNNFNFNWLAFGRSLKVIDASETLANGIYVANNSNANFYVNENNYRIINSGNTNVWTLFKPSSGIGYEVPAGTSSFNLNQYTSLYRTSGSNTSVPYSHKEHLSTKQVENSSVGWFRIGNPNENINVSRLVTNNLTTWSEGRIGGFAYSAQNNRLGYVNFSYNGFGGSNTATGSYLEISVTTGIGLQFSFDHQPKFIKVNSSGVYTYTIPSLPSNSPSTSIAYFAPNFIYDDHGYNSFPGDTAANNTLQDAILSKERINFRKPLSSNLHQAKKVNLKLKFERNDRAKNEQIKVIKNTFPVQEKDYIGFERVIEFYDEKDNNTYISTPFFSLTGKDYSFEQKELFIYRSRPDMNSPTSQNVMKW